MNDGDVCLAKKMEALRRNGNISAKDELRDIFEGKNSENGFSFCDLDRIPVFSDASALFLNVKRDGVRTRGIKASNVGDDVCLRRWSLCMIGNILQKTRFVGQTDA